MRKPVCAAALTLLAAALSVGLSATSSFAATATWTVSPGGSVTGSAGKTTLTDNTSGLTVTCTSSATTGTLKSGTGLSNPIGHVTSVAFNNCTAAGQTLSISTGTVSWPLTAGSFNSSTGVTHGAIKKIHFAVSSSICSFVIDGTGATADNGMVKVTYNNGTHVLKILPKNGNLHLYNVNGCLGLVNSGDAASITSAYKITPAQTITSP